jgi:hypothetical protein
MKIKRDLNLEVKPDITSANIADATRGLITPEKVAIISEQKSTISAIKKALELGLDPSRFGNVLMGKGYLVLKEAYTLDEIAEILIKAYSTSESQEAIQDETSRESTITLAELAQMIINSESYESRRKIKDALLDLFNEFGRKRISINATFIQELRTKILQNVDNS